MALGKWTEAEVVMRVCVSVCARARIRITGWVFCGRRWKRQECVFEMQRVARAVIGHCVEEEQGVFSLNFIIIHTTSHTCTHTHTQFISDSTVNLLLFYLPLWLNTRAKSEFWALEVCVFVPLCCIQCIAALYTRTHTHTHTHTHTEAHWQSLVVGPGDQFIYMQWKRNRGLEGIKQKREGERKRKQQGIMEKTQWNERVFSCSQGQTRPIYYLDGSVCMCVCFVLPVSCMISIIFPEALPSSAPNGLTSTVQKQLK